jgi:hypothetical protein
VVTNGTRSPAATPKMVKRLSQTGERAVIRFNSKIEKLEQRSYKVWIKGHGRDAVFEDIPIGWFMHIQGSGEALYVGDSKPDMNVGDAVVLSISKV